MSAQGRNLPPILIVSFLDGFDGAFRFMCVDTLPSMLPQVLLPFGER